MGFTMHSGNSFPCCVEAKVEPLPELGGDSIFPQHEGCAHAVASIDLTPMASKNAASHTSIENILVSVKIGRRAGLLNDAPHAPFAEHVVYGSFVLLMPLGECRDLDTAEGLIEPS